MSNTKPPISIDILTTLDGSPTVSLSGGEKMHSMDGALSETLFIYGSNIEKSMPLSRPRILSLGLGIGYNELLSMAYLIKNQRDDFAITSFEIVDELQNNFIQWLKGEVSPLNPVYDEVSLSISQHFDIQQSLIRSKLLKAFEQKNFLILGAVPEKNPTHFRYTSILYDAFSSNTDAPLWSSTFLHQFLQEYKDLENCCFSTYAATGALKRALKDHGFSLEKRAGFARKRESTMAIFANN